MPSDKPTAANFVQEYAAKRAAQLERAKKIREARLQINQQQPMSSMSSSNNSKNKPSAIVADNVNKDVGVATSILPITACGRRIASVVEEDFKRATRAGIITPDQARQLWAMLSDQIVQVDTTENSALNSTNCNSLPCSLKGISGSTMKFGNTITIDSLRASIAQFKEQQKKEQEEKQQQDMRIKPKTKTHGVRSSNTVNEVYELATRMFAPQSPGVIVGNAGTAISRLTRKEQSRTNSNDYGGLSNETREPSTSNSSAEKLALRQESAPPLGAGRREKQAQKRPPWNFDVDIEDDNPDDNMTFQTSSKPPPLWKGRKVGDSNVGKQKRYANNMTTQFDEISVGAKSSRPEIQQEQQYVQPFSTKTTSGTKKTNSNFSQKQSSQHVTSLDDVVVGADGGGRGITEALIAPQMQQKEPLIPCDICGRTFRASILSRHTDACAKVHKKRKVFDMKQHRLEGIDGIKEVCPSGQSTRGSRKQQQQQQPIANTNANAPVGVVQNKLPKWKIQHEQFQAAMRAMKQINSAGGGGGVDGTFGGGKGAQLPSPPPPMPEEYDDRVPCPHCGRKFAELTAQRHIPKCMTTIAKPKGIRPTRSMVRRSLVRFRYRTAWRELLHPLPIHARKMEWLKRDCVEQNEAILRQPYYTLKSYSLPPSVGQHAVTAARRRSNSHTCETVSEVMQQPRHVTSLERLEALRGELQFPGAVGPSPPTASVTGTTAESYAEAYGARLRPRYPETWDTVPPHQPSRGNL